jgi:hypothetical protein
LVYPVWLNVFFRHQPTQRDRPHSTGFSGGALILSPYT